MKQKVDDVYNDKKLDVYNDKNELNHVMLNK